MLYEGDGAAPLDNTFATMTALLEKGYAVTRSTAGGQVAPLAKGSLVVLGKFAGGSAPAAEDSDGSVKVRMHDITNRDIASVTALVEEERAATGAAQHGAWKPWFPVIDYDRCTNCMQCLSFCLFGVYGVDGDSHIQVQNNDNCKTNCPACSRVCPEAAIMFPKYKAGPINGDVVSAADLNREKMKIDISALLGGDVYSMLRERTLMAQSRFSKERDSAKALTRQKCLVKLAGWRHSCRSAHVAAVARGNCTPGGGSEIEGGCRAGRAEIRKRRFFQSNGKATSGGGQRSQFYIALTIL